MQSYVARRVLNGIIWTVCGVIVIMTRVLFTRGPSLIIWEILGGAMIFYGASRLVWALVKGAPEPVEDALAQVAG